MLLKHLYDFAHSRKILHDIAFVEKHIRWIIPVDKEGRLVSEGVIESHGEDKKGKIYKAPKTFLDKGQGGVAEFLADGITALFGYDPDPKAKLSDKQRRIRDDNNRTKNDHFWSQIRDAFEHTRSPLLAAILAFREHYGINAPFLRYGKSSDPKKQRRKEGWWVKTADGSEAPVGADQFTFQTAGRLLIEEDSTIRPYWRSFFHSQIASKETESELGTCLVTSRQDVPIAKTHLPLIKGIPGGKQRDRKIVSYDKDPFVSYGFEQSGNAPVSVEAVVAYVNAVNWMTAREDHSIYTENEVILFWAKKSPVLSGVFSSLLKLADPLVVAQFLKSPWAGLDRKLVCNDDFLSVAMSGNGGRVIIRHWMEVPVDTAIDNLSEWFKDLAIVQFLPGHAKEETKSPCLAIKELAKSTIAHEKDIDPTMLLTLYRAAIERKRVPIIMLHPVMQRLAADLSKYGADILCSPLPSQVERAAQANRRTMPAGSSRFALLRLILNRNRKGSEPMIEPQIFETDDAAYNCGRLLAVLADAQAKAHDYKLEGAGVAERYFGAASVSPSSVFPLLLRLNRHHLDKIKKSDKYASHAGYIEDDIQAISTSFKPDGPGAPPSFPRYLELQAQGRFAIGFYQQKAYSDTRKVTKSKKQAAATDSERGEIHE
jgi:CRISPR-associated protein Csd1